MVSSITNRTYHFPHTQRVCGRMKFRTDYFFLLYFLIFFEAVLVTDVGQNQMISARYFKYTKERSPPSPINTHTVRSGAPKVAPMLNPDYMKVASAYDIPSKRVFTREELKEAIAEMLATDGPFLLEACVVEEGNVLPMNPPGGSVNQMLLEC